ncbi:MAG: LTA synthase family protein [Anaerorhabdus sp.]
MGKIKKFWNSCKSLSYLRYKIILGIVTIVNFLILMIWFQDLMSLSLLFYAMGFTIVMGIGLLLPKIIDRLAIYLFLVAFYIYFTAQEIYYSAFGQFFLFSTAFGAKEEVAGMTSSVAELITTKVYFVIALLIVELLVFILIGTREKISMKKYLLYALSGVICFVFSAGLLGVTNLVLEKQREEAGVLNYYGTSHYFFNYLPNTNVVVNRFGLMGLLCRDTVGQIFIRNSTQYGIDDELIVEVLEAIGEENAQRTNDYTNIFEGKSLVIIQAESLMNLAIDEVLTPTLYQLREEGLNFEGFNAPLLYGSTADTEFLANTSLFPVSTGEITFDMYNQNEYPTALAKMFTEAGYYSSAYHANYAEYYSRDVMLPNLGYEFFDVMGMGVNFLDLDSVTLDKIKWIYNWAPQYFSYFITYNGHQPYAEDQCSSYFLTSFKETILERYPDIDERTMCYFAKNMDLDGGLARYVEDIKNNNYDVVLMIFGDHYAKNIETDGYPTNKTPLIIWSNEIESEVIEKRASTLDLLPTIANMFGLEYDERTVFGWDIMDESYNGFYFNNYGQIVTDDFMYDQSSGTIELFNDNYTVESAQEKVNSYIMRMNVSRTIVETDFFARYPEYGVSSSGQ